ncbi:alpha/beta hydrolase fold domain-containing protein [bacterium]|nr:alpha/beta hydrolase fold domain-containing protein [bacterium]
MKRLWLWFPRWLRITFQVAVSIVAFVACLVGGVWWYLHPAVQRTDGVVYGQRHGRALTLDVIRPAKPNGLGIALMVSGGWKSGKPGETPVWLMAPLLRRGYTVFAICHISQPQATVMEIIEDVYRGVRFVRYHAKEYGIDPDRLGVTGGSAGGHLSLMLATRGGPGPADAPDPVDRESSVVQAVAIFYPVTDLLNLGTSTENPGDGGPPKSFVKAFGFAEKFGADSTNMPIWKTIGRDCSPIYFVSSNLPPTLIYHGDADTLVPLDQSQRFCQRAAELGCDVKLVVHHGGKHGWLSMIWDIRTFAAWFDDHLKKAKN